MYQKDVLRECIKRMYQKDVLRECIKRMNWEDVVKWSLIIIRSSSLLYKRVDLIDPLDL